MDALQGEDLAECSDRRDGRRRAVLHALLSICLIATQNGCSFLFVRGPSAEPGRSVRDCTTSRLAPVIDTIFTGVQVLRLGIDAAASDAAFQNAPINRGTDIGLGLGLGLLFGASAAYGYAATNKCERISHRSGSPPADANEPSETEPAETAPAETKKTDAPAPTSVSAAPPAETPKPFDSQAARAAILAALERANRKCHPPAVQTEARLTYAIDGSVSSVVLDPPLADAPVQECVSGALLEARVPAYRGESVTVKKSVHFGP